MRRFILLAALSSLSAVGCCYDRPYLPRLQSGWGCGSGTCGGSGGGLLNRPILDLPIIDRPLLNRPILAPHYGGGVPISTVPGYSGGYAGGEYGTPLPYYQPAPGGYPVGDPGCVGCNGANGGHHVGSVGTPAYGPHGYPGGGAGGAGIPIGSAPMPMQMPSAMPGGIPHDSSLLKMPTIVPPGTTVRRPEELARTAGSGK